LKKRVASIVAVAAIVLGTAPPLFAHDPGTVFGPRLTPEIEQGSITITLEPVATGLVAPNLGTAAPGEPGRLYLTDQPGQLYVIDLDSGAKTIFLDVSARLVPLGKYDPGGFDERGLLGVAFHPSYQSNGLFYTYTSEPASGNADFSTIPDGMPIHHQNVIAEWKANAPGNPAAGVDLNSRRELLRANWPSFNHDGGDVVFGPDGMLYITMGDGGGADDQDGQEHADGPIFGHQAEGNGQKLNTHHGKIHRIDVNGRDSTNGQYGIPADNPFVGTPGAVAEIWAYGFRNPVRIAFDPQTGELYVGDVGQNDIEEVDIVVKGGNYGWALKEGSAFFDPRGFEPNSGEADLEDKGRIPPGLALIDPIAEYDTHHDGHSVIGGFVYHGSRIAQLSGRYVFGDFARVFANRVAVSGRLFYLENGRVMEFQIAGQPFLDVTLLGWGQDANGELYMLGNQSGVPSGETGVIMRLAPG
jgi:glucose/arabinose dehydrogenase